MSRDEQASLLTELYSLLLVEQEKPSEDLGDWMKANAPAVLSTFLARTNLIYEIERWKKNVADIEDTGPGSLRSLMNTLIGNLTMIVEMPPPCGVFRRAADGTGFIAHGEWKP